MSRGRADPMCPKTMWTWSASEQKSHRHLEYDIEYVVRLYNTHQVQNLPCCQGRHRPDDYVLRQSMHRDLKANPLRRMPKFVSPCHELSRIWSHGWRGGQGICVEGSLGDWIEHALQRNAMARLCGMTELVCGIYIYIYIHIWQT